MEFSSFMIVDANADAPRTLAAKQDMQTRLLHQMRERLGGDAAVNRAFLEHRVTTDFRLAEIDGMPYGTLTMTVVPARRAVRRSPRLNSTHFGN